MARLNGHTSWLTSDNLNSNVVSAEYAVRGDIVRRAQVIEKELEEDSARYSFQKVIWCNIGNPQILGQKPITFFRQVLSIMEYPELLQSPHASELFPQDVRQRAQCLLAAIPGGLGAYSESPGATALREHIANSITKRDGFPCDPEQLYMTDGASPGVHYIMHMMLRDNKDGFMVPIPQYPLYSAALSLYGGELVPYLLDEDKGWALNIAHLRDQLSHAQSLGVVVRGIVLINPGNPTGQCLDEANQQDVIQFCLENQLVLIADEVYQSNVYDQTKSFSSFKKVAAKMGVVDRLPLVSLHSTSKGFLGECGRRGGYMEVTGFPPAFHDQLLKLTSINLCPNLSGQVCCTLMMTPPEEGDPSYSLFAKERDQIIGSLKRRAELMEVALNKLEGVRCNPAEGALYVFPRITLPEGACKEAAKLGKPADWLYCKELLESTGIVVVPGSGFGQADGTFHFRTTFLPPEEDIGGVVNRLAEFHHSFLTKYSSS